MASRIFALLIWAAVAASLAFWGLRWLAQPTAVPANAMPVSLDNAARGDMRRLLSGPAKAASAAPIMSAAAELAGRIKLIGLVAPQAGQHNGVALLSIDGKPARAVRMGGTVEGDLVLQNLTQRGAEIGPADGPAAVTLDLPLLPPPAMGALPAVVGLVRNNPNLPRVPIEGQAPLAPNAVQGLPTMPDPAPQGAPGGLVPPPHRGQPGGSPA